MLTPQEVAEHAFSKASFGGYNMAMVDEFLDLVTADYTTLYKENAALKTKMKVLADKIEEYRSTEEAMRKAMLSAQKMADQMVAEAEEQASSIVDKAEQEAKEKIASIRQEVDSEQLRLTAAQNATAAYVAKLKDLYENEMLYISSLSKLTAAPKQPDPVSVAADAIGTAVEKAVEEVPAVEEDDEPTVPMDGIKPAQPEEEPQKPLEEDSLYQELKRGPIPFRKEEPEDEPEQDAEAEEDEGEEEPPRRIDFNNLKFGKDYEID